jgi:hypothetical protein
VEFEIELEGDRQKAVNVTAPGGGPIEPPIRRRKFRSNSGGKPKGDKSKDESMEDAAES